MLILKNVEKVFNQGQATENIALHDLNLQVEKEEFITIIGSNGAGKSTLLNVIAGVYSVDSGVIHMNGEVTTTWPPHERARHIGRVFQDPLLGTAAEMTIEENLALARRRGQRRRLKIAINNDLRNQFRSSLSLLGLGLEERLEDPVSLLSGGQRQALTLLMATLGEPQVLLLDEHTASLDPQSAKDIIKLTRKIKKEQNLTILMVTHNMYQALELGDRTIMMDRGEIILDIEEPERSSFSVKDLQERFAQIRGEQLGDDVMLLT